jgi:hypothetical protein
VLASCGYPEPDSAKGAGGDGGGDDGGGGGASPISRRRGFSGVLLADAIYAIGGQVTGLENVELPSTVESLRL